MGARGEEDYQVGPDHRELTLSGDFFTPCMMPKFIDFSVSGASQTSMYLDS